MRRTTIIGFHRRKWIETLCRNHALLWLAAVFLLGLLFAALSLDGASALTAEASRLRDAYLAARVSKGFLSVVCGSLIFQLPFALLLFLCGTSMAGVVLAPMLVCYRGFSVGLLLSMFYASDSLKGIAFCVLLIVPYSVLSVLATLLSARESVGFSLLLARLVLPNRTSDSVAWDFRAYCARHLFLLLLFLAAALLDALLSLFFLRFFAF